MRASTPGQAPVRMDDECLLAAGGAPLHGALAPDAPATMRFAASHIEPIEDEA
jgi:hypothetical protein